MRKPRIQRKQGVELRRTGRQKPLWFYILENQKLEVAVATPVSRADDFTCFIFETPLSPPRLMRLALSSGVRLAEPLSNELQKSVSESILNRFPLRHLEEKSKVQAADIGTLTVECTRARSKLV